MVQKKNLGSKISSVVFHEHNHSYIKICIRSFWHFGDFHIENPKNSSNHQDILNKKVTKNHIVLYKLARFYYLFLKMK